MNYVVMQLLPPADVSACLNHTKFEYNGSTGYLLKPAVMLNDKDGEIFNPSAQAVLKNIVPVNLKIKVGSKSFICAYGTTLFL